MGRIKLEGVTALNHREPPENLIRSGCARILVDDMVVEMTLLRELETLVRRFKTEPYGVGLGTLEQQMFSVLRRLDELQ